MMRTISTVSVIAFAFAALTVSAIAQAGGGTTPAAGSGSGSAAGSGSGSGSGTDAAAGSDAGSGSGSAVVPVAPPNPEDMPVNLRIRAVEQRVQALKERAWQAKAHIAMIKEAVIGGGVGAQASITHENNMGSSFRLIKLVYSLDGTQVFSKSDEEGETLYKEKKFDVITGPIAPGSHTLSVLALYRGHGYGVFKYLEKYTFTVRSSHTFTVGEGKSTKVEANAYEKGKANTPLEKRPAIDFKVTQVNPEGTPAPTAGK
jgi:hypothetical protein